MDTRARIAVFASGGGSNMQALIDASKRGDLAGDVVFVVASKHKAFALTRAEREGIESTVFKLKTYETYERAGQALLAMLRERAIDFIALAGYLSLIPQDVVRAYHHRIVNIHPALLPKFGGKGMYGHHVHEAVLATGEKESGPSVHLVDEIYDNGQVLEQSRVPVLPDDTPDTLAARVLEQEHLLYPKVLNKLIKGEYKISHE